MPSAERRFPRWVWIVLAVLLTMCVPWYVSATRPAVWAFPLWGVWILGFSVLLAVFTALVYLKYWPVLPEDADAPEDGPEARSAEADTSGAGGEPKA